MIPVHLDFNRVLALAGENIFILSHIVLCVFVFLISFILKCKANAKIFHLMGTQKAHNSLGFKKFF